MNTTPPLHVFICTLCDERTAVRGTPQAQSGKNLLQAVQAALAGDDTVKIHPVNCLGGCDAPCTAAFAATGRGSVVLTKLSATNPKPLLALLKLWQAHPRGRLYWRKLPAHLQQYYAHRIPPLPAAAKHQDK